MIHNIDAFKVSTVFTLIFLLKFKPSKLASMRNSVVDVLSIANVHFVHLYAKRASCKVYVSTFHGSARSYVARVNVSGHFAFITTIYIREAGPKAFTPRFKISLGTSFSGTERYSIVDAEKISPH